MLAEAGRVPARLPHAAWTGRAARPARPTL